MTGKLAILVVYEVTKDLELWKKIPCQSEQLELRIFSTEEPALEDVRKYIGERKVLGKSIVDEHREVDSVVREFSRKYSGVIVDLNRDYGSVIFRTDAEEAILKAYFRGENPQIN